MLKINWQLTKFQDKIMTLSPKNTYFISVNFVLKKNLYFPAWSTKKTQAYYITRSLKIKEDDVEFFMKVISKKKPIWLFFEKEFFL